MRPSVDSTNEELINHALAKLVNPFVSYIVNVVTQASAQLKTMMLFESYRLGLPTRKENTLTVTFVGRARELKEPVITIGHWKTMRYTSQTLMSVATVAHL